MRFPTLASTFLVLGALATSGRADPIATSGVGPRVGLSLGPDQLQMGGHLDVVGLADQVRFRPNAVLGLGDDRVSVAVNADVLYRFREQWDAWSPYLGGGPGLRFDEHDHADEDLDAGLDLVGGIERGLGSGDRFLVEMRLGILDGPDLGFMAGWVFAR